MASGSEPNVEPRDRTKWLWAGLLAVFAVMAVVIWVLGSPPKDISRARARHILITFNQADPTDRARALERANDLLDRIKKGESFAALAKEYSDDAGSASRGGDLNYAPKGVYEESIEKYIWTAPIGVPSGILSSSHGYHIVEVTDRYLSPADRYNQANPPGNAASASPGG